MALLVRLIQAKTLLKEDNILSMQFHSFIDVLLHKHDTLLVIAGPDPQKVLNLKEGLGPKPEDKKDRFKIPHFLMI